MSVKLDWYDETQAIIIRRYSGHWTIEDAANSMQSFDNLAQTVVGRFDVISDFTDAAYTLPIGTLWEWKEKSAQRHQTYPNWKFTVVVSNGDVLNAYVKEGIESTDLIQQHYRLAKNIEEAVQIIQADRTKARK